MTQTKKQLASANATAKAVEEPQKPLGLHAGSAGFLLNNHLFPPESFAEAYFGTLSADAKLEMVRGVLESAHKPNGFVLEKTPVLHYLCKQYSGDNAPEQILGELTSWLLQGDKKSDKLVSQSAIREVNKTGSIATHSSSGQARLRIASRREMPDYNVSLYHATYQIPTDLLEFFVGGGTEFAATSKARGTHYSLEHELDRPFLLSLRESSKSQYEQPIHLIDYTYAAALTALEQAWKQAPEKIAGGLGFVAGRKVLSLWSFERAPAFALETVLRSYIPDKFLVDVGLTPADKLDVGINSYLLGHTAEGFVDKQCKPLLEAGIIRRSTFIKGRHFPKGTWAVIEALEQHMLGEHRSFAGYTIEFRNTPYETTAIRFEFLSADIQDRRRKSASILFDDNFELPFIMYLTHDNADIKKQNPLGKRNPATQVNIPTGRRTKESLPFQMYDWANGRMANCTIFEPSDLILRQAANIELEAGMNRITHPQERRHEYMALAQRRRYKSSFR